MADYSAGNLVLNVTTNASSAISELEKLNSTIKKLNSASNNIGGRNSKNVSNNIGKNINFLANINRLYFFINYTRRMAQGIANLIQLGVNYNEVLNLWQVAMRGNVDTAEEFISKMNKAYGISKDLLMNYQAIFKNMLGSLGGISENVSYQLSEFLTQMALDFSSLYNTSIQKAMTTFQQVLSGQVRPVRTVAGYDITENTIYQMYQQLGGSKSMRQLSETEKRLLRVYAVLQQMKASGAIGDLEKTIESSANQLRIMTQLFREIGLWLGRIVEVWLEPILPIVNATLIVIREITKALAIQNGVTEKNFLVSGLEEANEQIDKLQGKLLSFDKFEALNSGSGNNILGIDQSLLNALSEYDGILDKVSYKAQDIAEKWLPKWVNENGTLTTNAEDLFETFKQIPNVLLTILAFTNPIKSAFLALSYNALFDENARNQLLSFVNSIYDISKVLTPLLIKLITFVGDNLWLVLNTIIAFKAVNFLGNITKVTSTIYSMGKGLGSLFGNLANYLGSLTEQTNAFGNSLLGTKQGWNTMTSGAKTASVALGAMGGVIAYMALDKWFSTMDSGTKQLAGAITLLVSALTAGAIAWLAYHGSMTWGTAIPIILTAIGAGIAGITAMIGDSSSVSASTTSYTPTSNVGQQPINVVGVANNSASGYSTYQQNNVGNVYIDGKKAGKITSQASYGEQKRVGLLKSY